MNEIDLLATLEPDMARLMEWAEGAAAEYEKPEQLVAQYISSFRSGRIRFWDWHGRRYRIDQTVPYVHEAFPAIVKFRWFYVEEETVGD